MTVWIWIDERLALALHTRCLVLHGGAAGLRDIGLLRSALARPRNLAAYEETAGATGLAAAYTAGILQNHPFIDGNKRTGFLAGVLFLELNGRRFTATEAQSAEMVLALASGGLEETRYRDFLEANSEPAPGR